MEQTYSQTLRIRAGAILASGYVESMGEALDIAEAEDVAVIDGDPCIGVGFTTREDIIIWCGHGMESHDTDDGDCSEPGCECLRYRTDGAQD